MKKETNQAAQQAYHEARRVGHTKEEARSIRDNWKIPPYETSAADDDDIYWENCCDEDDDGMVYGEYFRLNGR